MAEKIEKTQTVATVAEHTAPKADVTAMDAELKQLELEAKRLEVAFQKANLEDMQERLQERELKREQSRQKGFVNGSTLKQINHATDAAQARCNHRKGGQGANGVIGGQGDDSQYAVIKHQFANGDIWVRCLRCGKTWKPPIHADYTSEELYEIARERYKTAIEFQTRNVTSTSAAFRFSDNGEYYREVTRGTNLR